MKLLIYLRNATMQIDQVFLL